MEVISHRDFKTPDELRADRKRKLRRWWMDAIRAEDGQRALDLIDDAIEAEIPLSETFYLAELGRVAGVPVREMLAKGLALDGVARIVQARFDDSGSVIEFQEPEEPPPPADASYDEKREWTGRQLERESNRLHAELEDVDLWASHPADEQATAATEAELSDRAEGWPADGPIELDSRSERGWLD